MKKLLPKSFFDRPALVVARELLGKYIIRNYRGHETALMITEVEAYDGLDDRASHASKKRYLRDSSRGRASILFGEPGRWYMFFTYGIHWMANVVVGPIGHPAAILLRGAEGVAGPARLTKFLKIGGLYNDKPATHASGLWFEDRGVYIPQSRVIRSRRVGVDYAGPVWAGKKWNFKVKLSPPHRI